MIVRKIVPLALGILWSAGVVRAEAAGPVDEEPVPHLELEMTGRDYLPLVEHVLDGKADDTLKIVLDTGKRNLSWLDLINQSRDPADRLQLSTAGTQVGVPIEQPGTSSRSIVLSQWNTELAALPVDMKKILIDGNPLTTVPPVSDQDFLTHARLLDRIYQRASRWLLQEPSLDSYAARSYMDVRGFYFLNRESDLEAKLRGWNSLAAADRVRLQGWLVSLCTNSRATASVCDSRLNGSLSRDGHTWNFYTQNRAAGQAMWDSFFKIPITRSDVAWTAANPNAFHIPFLDPNRPEVMAWLRDNIQDEWRWQSWQLLLDFKSTGDDTMTHITFQEGATPHVNRIAGSEITMDGNRNLQEYSSRWTIRHEYGHVLGFPDCYIEFYDQSASVMVNYQLDTTNLMCSRAGHLQQQHVDELRRVYFH